MGWERFKCVERTQFDLTFMCITLNNLLTEMDRGEVKKMVRDEIGKEAGTRRRL